MLLYRSDLKVSAKNRQNFLAEWKKFISFHSRFSMDFAIFRRKFDEILPEFHRNGQEMKKCLDILKKCEKNARNFRKCWISGIRWNCWEISFFISFFSMVSLGPWRSAQSRRCRKPLRLGRRSLGLSSAGCGTGAGGGGDGRHDTSLFSRLVLGYIETKFCTKDALGFSRSTKLSSWFLKKLQNFGKKFIEIAKF